MLWLLLFSTPFVKNFSEKNANKNGRKKRDLNVMNKAILKIESYQHIAEFEEKPKRKKKLMNAKWPVVNGICLLFIFLGVCTRLSVCVVSRWTKSNLTKICKHKHPNNE